MTQSAKSIIYLAMALEVGYNETKPPEPNSPDGPAAIKTKHRTISGIGIARKSFPKLGARNRGPSRFSPETSGIIRKPKACLLAASDNPEPARDRQIP
jgi:hypothetical protein